jgi:hypothetical protein
MLTVITISLFVIWPTQLLSAPWIGLAAVLIAFYMIYPFWYMRKTRVVIEDGWLRVYDIEWPDQSMAVGSAAGMRRHEDGYWVIYSLSGESVRVRNVWGRSKMNELAGVLNVPIKGWFDGWRTYNELDLRVQTAFERWLRVRRKLARRLGRSRKMAPSRSAISDILALRQREVQLWKAFLDAKSGDGK